LAVAHKGNKIEFFETSTNYTYHSQISVGFQPYTVKYSKDGSKIAYSGQGSNQKIYIVEATSPYTSIRNISTSQENILEVDFNYDGTLIIATGDKINNQYGYAIYNVLTGNLVRYLDNYSGQGKCARFASNG
jgi:WD40 repeat protein